MGNLLDTVDYYDIHSVDYNWSGRRLDGINIYDDGALTQSIEYKYNSEGIRTYKKVGNDEYEYVLDGNLVLVEFINGNPIYYTYDANDQIISMNYNYNEYFYVFDLLGNVIGLMNESGQLVVTYTYDAWGNQRVVGSNGSENTSPTFIGNINPYRYRGYRYDAETGYYYLQARYYDPEIGRFISTDDASYLDDDASSGISLYAYAANNPVMFVDPNGNSFKSLWESVSEWFRNTFGYVAYKETSTTTWYGLYEIRAGIGYGNESNKPVVFYTSIPDKWWKLDQYSIGLKFTNKKGNGFKGFVGTNSGFGWFN